MAEAAAINLATDAAMAMGQLVMGRTIDEVKLVWGLKDELEKLQSRFLNLQRFLKDIGRGKHADKRDQVNEWLLNVKDAAYFADDIMDSYAYEIIRREREQKKQFVKKFRAFFTRYNPIVFRIRMSHRVSAALSTFNDLELDAQRIGLKQLQITADGILGTSANDDEDSVNLSEARQNAAANAIEFVGREDEMEKFLRILCSPSNQEGLISTIAIRGLGGLGKTTFARCLYDSENIDAYFEKKFWISVSDNFTIKRILKEMLESVTSKEGNFSNTDAVTKQLRENLKNKKYLLVLDDVWCKDPELWSSLKNALQRIGGLPGCLVLITTRLSDVAARSQAVYTHLLRGLSEKEGWALLKQRAFVGVTSPNISDFEEIGKRIIEKCKGVPLAIKAIGGILQSKKLPGEWELIEKSEIWDLPQNDENQILPSLRLTFNHLPSPSLKQCFAYCSTFCLKNYIMQKDELVDIWLAQGFLHGSEIKNLTMEEIGEKYVMVLLNYSLLDEVKGEEPGYKMHDLVYDLAVDVSGKDLLFWKQKDHQKIDSCRHLVIDTEEVEALSNLPIAETLRKLRTISNGLPHNVLAHAKYLRTLAVDGCEIKELPSSIGLLKHLRFLSLSYNPIKTLPDSIGKLYLLQTLRLLDCFDMMILPAILYRLTNLNHVPTTTFMLASRGLLELTNLHTLPRLELGDEDGWSIDELGGLHKLMGEIHISGLEHVKTKDNARKADLAGKAKVSKITLVWAEEREEISSGSYDEDVLDGLQPHPNIISLELQNFFGLTFPSWMVSMAVVSEGGSSPSPLKNLTSFKLLNCSRCQMLPTLGHLPCLKYLVLSGLKVESIGNDFYGVPLNQNNSNVNHVSFPSLTELEISEFRSWKTWVVPSSEVAKLVFPVLEKIILKDCPELETIPALDFQSLKTLELENLGIKSLDITNDSSSVMSISKVNLKLELLDISNCRKLVSLPRELQYVVSLKTIKVDGCSALTSLPTDLFQGLTSLSELSISTCEALNSIPTSLEECTSLEMLTITYCPSIEGPTPDFSKLKGLKELWKYGNSINTMISMLKAVQNLPCLTILATGEFKNEVEHQMYFSDLTPIQQNQSLTSLIVKGHHDVNSLPEQLQLLIGIKTLILMEFHDVEQLPEWVAYLSALERLVLLECDNLKSLPSKEALSQLTQLRALEMIGCPILAERCDKDSGPEWSKISNIPYIEIEEEVVQNLSHES